MNTAQEIKELIAITGMSHKELADMFGLKTKTVTNTLSQCAMGKQESTLWMRCFVAGYKLGFKGSIRYRPRKKLTFKYGIN